MRTLFVLHDVAYNKYSRDVIENDHLKNLHDLFTVKPTWYNRSKVVCHLNAKVKVVLVSFNHATPLTSIHMVPLPETSRNIQKIVACVQKTLKGGVTTTNALKTSAAALGVGVYANKKYQQHRQHQLNQNCLKSIKKKIGLENTNIRVSCQPQDKDKNVLTLNEPAFAKGALGEVFNTSNPEVIVKNQRATCSSFITEIDCFTLLNENTLLEDRIVPQLFDAYVCFDSNKKIEDVTYNEITYGYVMEKLDESLFDFVQKCDATVFKNKIVNEVVQQLMNMFAVLDKNNIKHGDLHVENIMVKHLDHGFKLFLIDFGAATRTSPSSFGQNHINFVFKLKVDWIWIRKRSLKNSVNFKVLFDIFYNKSYQLFFLQKLHF